MSVSKDILSGTLPRWVTALAMALCAFLLQRALTQQDNMNVSVQTHSQSIAVMQNNTDRMADALAKVDQIARLLEQRLVRLESREESRRP